MFTSFLLRFSYKEITLLVASSPPTVVVDIPKPSIIPSALMTIPVRIDLLVFCFTKLSEIPNTRIPFLAI